MPYMRSILTLLLLEVGLLASAAQAQAASVLALPASLLPYNARALVALGFLGRVAPDARTASGQHSTKIWQDFALNGDIQVFDLQIINAFLFIKGKVNGQTGHFMFDSGNPNRVVLNNHFLKLPAGRAAGEGSVGSGQRYSRTFYDTIDSLSLGNGLAYQKLAGIEGNSLGFLEHITPDCLGQIGFGFVDGYILKLDYTQRQLTCYRATSARRASQDFLQGEQVVGVLTYEVRTRPGDPLVHVKVGADDFICEFDTGQQGYVYLSEPQRQLLLAQQRLVLLAARDGDEQPCTLRGVDFGQGLKLDLHAIYVKNTHNRGLEKALSITEPNFLSLGYAFFNQFTTIWDTQAHKMYLCQPR